MKKVLLPIATAVMMLLAGAFFVKSSESETPTRKEKKLIPIIAQRSNDGKLITDPEKWDPNKGFFTTYVAVE